jgi:hypothetical protein
VVLAAVPEAAPFLLTTTTTTTSFGLSDTAQTSTQVRTKTKKKKVTIGYAVTVTDCFLKDPPHIQYNEPDHANRVKVQDTLLDNAAVLKQSIYLASQQSSEYDSKFHAFVHTDAVHCAPYMTKLGYHVQILGNPVNKTEMKNLELAAATKNGCCGEKEFMKLYSYLLTEHPVVVHLDLDTVVVQPLDPLFNLMIYPSNKDHRAAVAAMWLNSTDQFPDQVDFMFTRDYNMVDPPYRQVHQIGVQGGFLVIRPNVTDFERYVEIIIDGANYTIDDGWGGPALKFGGYYGAATVQGLTGYYFSHLEPHRAVELNRCYYNTMVDDPMNTADALARNRTPICRSLESTCQDCRTTNLSDIYTAHFTICGKPDWCSNAADWGVTRKPHHELCMELFREWHKARLSIEELWVDQFMGYQPMYAIPHPEQQDEFEHYLNFSLGHCRRPGTGEGPPYIPMDFPEPFYNLSLRDPI